eukprot:4796284-Lingulodinium_polyedra.AAC.1
MQLEGVAVWRRQAESLRKHGEAMHGQAAKLPAGKRKTELMKAGWVMTIQSVALSSQYLERCLAA